MFGPWTLKYRALLVFAPGTIARSRSEPKRPSGDRPSGWVRTEEEGIEKTGHGRGVHKKINTKLLHVPSQQNIDPDDGLVPIRRGCSSSNQGCSGSDRLPGCKHWSPKNPGPHHQIGKPWRAAFRWKGSDPWPGPSSDSGTLETM